MARRSLSGALLAGGLLALTGCTAEGRLEVTSVNAVSVDLTVLGARSPYCNSDIPGLSSTPGRDSSGVITSCHYLGTVDPTQLGWALSIADAGELLALVFNPLGVPSAGPNDNTENHLDGVDVTIVMPGSVVEANAGRSSDREVRITEPEVLLLPGGLRIVALDHAGPAHWVWWLAGGLALGVGGTLAALRVLGRSREGAAAEPDEPWAGPFGEVGDSTPADAVTAAAASSADPGYDPSIWARPSEDVQPARAADGPAPDPSVWAPDEVPP